MSRAASCRLNADSTSNCCCFNVSMDDTNNPYGSTRYNKLSRRCSVEVVSRRSTFFVSDTLRKSLRAEWRSSIRAKPASIQAREPSELAAHDRTARICSSRLEIRGCDWVGRLTDRTWYAARAFSRGLMGRVIDRLNPRIISSVSSSLFFL